MASSSENWSGRSLTKNETNWTAKREWLVTQASTEAAALAATPLPGTLPIQNFGASHPASTFLRVVNVHCEQTGPTTWLVSVSYDTSSNSPTGGEPLLEPPTVTWDTIMFSEPVDRDIMGNPIVTTAGQPFTPSPTRDVEGDVMVLERNEPYYNLGLAKVCRGRVNANPATIGGLIQYDRRQILLKSMLPAESIRPNRTYTRMRYVLWMRDDEKYPWDFRVLNAGSMGSIGGASAKTLLPFHDGTDILNHPVFLDVSGKPFDTTLKLWNKVTGLAVAPGVSGIISGAIGAHNIEIEEVQSYGGNSTVLRLIFPMRRTFDLAALSLTFE